MCSFFLSACDGPNMVLSLIDTNIQQESPISIWAEMGQSLQLDHSLQNRPEVVAQIASFQTHKEDTYKILTTSAPYISYVYEEAQKRGLPAELALLPVIESEGNPNARSKVGAIGLWQLMPHTASDLGIKTNHAYDGRKDVIATTKAALDFLTDLHKNFEGDWLLAMAAYNWGPGSLQKAIKNQKKWYTGSNFWNLHIPLETQKYVPKLLALAAIIRDPARYGFTLPVPDERIHLASIQIHSHYELSEIMRTSGASLETLQRLNPAYRTLATTQGAPNKFLIPVAAQKELALESSKSISNNAKLSSVLYSIVPHGMVREGIQLAFSLGSAERL